MLTIEQIRAARALLDWSQSDLAEHAGLSQTGIARIENGTNKPNSKTLMKIHAAFDSADVEFIDTTGVKKRKGEVKSLSGLDGFKKFMDDVYETVKKVGGDVCLYNGMPDLFIKWLGEDWYNKHSDRMEKIQKPYNFKIIVRDDDVNFIASKFAEYRGFPDDLFHEKTFYSYGDKLAFLDFSSDSVHILILNQSEFSKSFRVLFEIAWRDVAIKK